MLGKIIYTRKVILYHKVTIPNYILNICHIVYMIERIILYVILCMNMELIHRFFFFLEVEEYFVHINYIIIF